MSPIVKPREPRSNDANRLTREDIQREEAQEAAWSSYEHGAPETGPGEDLEVDNIEADPDRPGRSD